MTLMSLTPQKSKVHTISITSVPKSGSDAEMISATDFQLQNHGFESRISQLAHQTSYRAGYR